MRRACLLAVAGVSLVSAGPVRAEDADLCSSLKSAWSAARADPASARNLRFSGADSCSYSDGDLRCYWHFASRDAASRTYDGFRTVATACFAPLGFTAVHKVLHGVETTSLQAPADEDPNVDLFLPPHGAVIGISIVTTQ